MKTATIARFVLGAAAIFAGAGLVGCGADTGQGAEGVGQASQALDGTAHSIDATAYAAITVDLQRSATCVVNGTYNGTAGDYPLVVSGIDPTGGAEVRDGYLFDRHTGVNGTWVKFSFGTASVNEVADAVAMTDPANHAVCYVIGGNKGGTEKANTWKFTLGSDAAHSGFVAGPTLNAARTNAVITQCQSKLMVVGGIDAGGDRSDVEVLSGGTWHQTVGLLGVARHNFAVAANDTKATDDATEFLISGGLASGSPTNRLEALHVPTGSGCATSSGAITSTLYANAAGTRLTTGVEAPVSFPKSFASLNSPAKATAFVVASGKPTGAATTQTQEVAVTTWNSTTGIAVTNATTAIANATSFAKAVRVPDVGVTTSPDAYMIVGGNAAGGVASVQEYQAGFGTNGWYATATLANARISPNAVYLPDLAKVLVAGGGSTVVKSITP